MPLDFPNFPNVGDVWTGTNGCNYVWSGAFWYLQPGTGPGGPITATGAITPRTAADHFADVVYAKDFGAVFDGNSHPLSAYYSTLAVAQAVYPKATALTNEIDGIAIQAAIDFCAARSGATHEYSFGGTVVLPQGKGLMNTPLTIGNSCVSLTNNSYGLGGRSSTAYTVMSAATKLLWSGPAQTAGQVAGYMLTVSPQTGGRLLSGCNLQGIVFECGSIAGCGGVLLLSVRNSKIEIGVHEPRGVLYPSAGHTSGSQAVTVSSTAAITVGQSLVSANLPAGSYVAAIVNSTTLTASAAATATGNATVCIGGEGMRMDVLGGLGDSNATINNEVVFGGNSEQAAANTAGPLLLLAGSAATAGAGPAYGNTCLNRFRTVQLVTTYGAQLVLNNTDHNMFDDVSCFAVGNLNTIDLVLNGSRDANNGPASFNWFRHVIGAKIGVVGTDTGGFTLPSIGTQVTFLDKQNGGVISAIGVGATVAMSADNQTTLMVPAGSTQPILPYPADNTAVGGNARGTYAVDLQTNRNAATQVASGQYTVVAGGQQNTATAIGAVVGGGTGNTVTGQYASIPGGGANLAGGMYSVATGLQANADLYALRAHSGAAISSNRRAQQQIQVFQATSANNTTPVRLTADGAAAGAVNVMNVTYASACYALNVQLTALDATTGANTYCWTQPCGLLRRNGGAGAMVYVPATPIITSNGTTTGIVVTEAADTVNGGYSLTFTPPTGNTSQWRVVATVTATRVDGI